MKLVDPDVICKSSHVIFYLNKFISAPLPDEENTFLNIILTCESHQENVDNRLKHN